MPPLRLAILEDVAANPGARTPDVRRRLNKPRNTVDRQLQALHMLGVLSCEERMESGKSVWHYFVEDRFDVEALRVPEMSTTRVWGEEERVSVGPDISGTPPDVRDPVWP
jgi:hypothetical protein